MRFLWQLIIITYINIYGIHIKTLLAAGNTCISAMYTLIYDQVSNSFHH